MREEALQHDEGGCLGGAGSYCPQFGGKNTKEEKKEGFEKCLKGQEKEVSSKLKGLGRCAKGGRKKRYDQMTGSGGAAGLGKKTHHWNLSGGRIQRGVKAAPA